MKDDIVCAFEMDLYSRRTLSEYYPNVTSLNKVIAGWAQKGISFLGIIHSHPNGLSMLSKADKSYFEDIFHHAQKIPFLCCPIVTYEKECVSLHGHVFDGTWHSTQFEVVTDAI